MEMISYMKTTLKSAIAMFLMLSLCACGSKEVEAETEPIGTDIAVSDVAESDGAMQYDNNVTIQYFEEEPEEVPFQVLIDTEPIDDLVFREYPFGVKSYACEIMISKETLLNVVKEPKAVVVYFNDELLETINYNNADILIDLADDGIYRFMVVDKDGTSIDITSQIQGTSHSDSGIMFLN